MPRAGIEPARYCYRGIFVPTTAFAAQNNNYVVTLVWGLDYVFISLRSLPLGEDANSKEMAGV